MTGPALPRIAALAPSDLAGIGLAASACRAGALGVLDLARVGLTRPALAALDVLDRRAAASFAARVRADDLAGLDLSALPTRLAVVVILDGDDSAGAIDRVRRAGRRAWCEVTSRDAADRAVAAGADGLILAGHEAGGVGSDESSFVLLQGVAARHPGVPAWVRGGIGPRSAAGCVAAGAAGVVLDGALLLARESPLDARARERVARWDGGETQVFGPASGPRLRAFAAPGSATLDRLRAADGGDWAGVAADLIGWGEGQAWPVGQDAAFAADLARRTGSAVGAIVREVERAIDDGLRQARDGRWLAPGSPLAQRLGTAYPILQGPMTRVSDVVPFAEAVADGGALPFLALSMLRGETLSNLIREAGAKLRGRPWGVGLLGFNPPDLRREQMAEVIEARPPFALLAGGRPDQARELEKAGIPTFLHAPSPGLLTQFVRDGARRFVLEGRECGGHVGPRSSLVLWEQAVAVLLEAIGKGAAPGEFQVVLAGGIHDDRSAAAAAATVAPLAAAGVEVGVLVGTAYLFTVEAVRTGAIVRRYQDEAVRCGSTVLLETGPGHEVRVGLSPFVAAFDAERRRLVGSGAKPEAVREALEALNAGRLRVAAKGLDRANGAGTLVAVAEADQFERGTYMIGQVAALRGGVTTVADLHRSIGEGSARWLDRRADPAATAEAAPGRPSDVAIVGMSAILPGAGDVRTFWENTLAGRDAITEIPADRWDWRLYYDADPKAPDKIVSKWGGFVPDTAFDPLRYGMPPASLPSIEPVQLLLLEATRAAIADAGYADRPFARERTAVVLGMGGGAAQLAMGYAFRSYLPMLDTVRPGAGADAMAACDGLLPEWTEDSFPGFLLNVAAGRVANRFDLGGANYTVDAACGSSLAAAALAVRELETGAADVVVLGGADTVQNPFTYLAFSKTQAFSPRGRCRPFDATADGIVISEGVSVLVLKRLADAERDGDRIYAVIKGVGASSDGRARGLTAPSPDGQVRAVERAYRKAAVDPRTVGYVEAHGTGTAVGDVVEVNSIARVFREAGAAPGSASIGSVKSTIGHTKCAAGLAGLINAALALHHKVLPPTIGVDMPNPKADLADGPFRVNTRPRPWVHADRTAPRRAGVSAFGFGGTNFHAVLEGYDHGAPAETAPARAWPAELFAWRAADRPALLSQVDALLAGLDRGARPALPDLARGVNAALRPPGGPTLAIVAGSLDDLAGKLRSARAAIAGEGAGLDDPRGVFFAARPKFAGEPIAFLFPGQGSQSVEMLADLARAFPEVRAAFDETDAALVSLGRTPVGPRVFPVDPANSPGLTESALAQPALGAAAAGLMRLLGNLGIEPDLVAGHSYGELAALHAAGSLTAEGLAALGEARGRWMAEALGDEPGAMAAVAAGPRDVAGLIEGLPGVIAANQNGPAQTVIAGPRAGVEQAVNLAGGRGVRARLLPVAGAFHTPALGRASGPLADLAAGLLIAPPDRPTYSNLDARPHPADPRVIAARLGEHVARPVEFAGMVAAMHDAGARVFVEVGPGSVLTALAGSILADRPHLAVACDAAGKPGLPTLLMALARLLAAGVDVRPDRLTRGRVEAGPAPDPLRLPPGDGRPAPSPTTWLVNGSRSRPIGQPEPRRLGQAADPAQIEAKPSPKSPPPASRNGFHPPQPVAAPPLAARNGTTMTPASNGPAPRPHPAPAETNPIPAARPGGADDRVMAAFQETMRSFLDVQRTTMLAYLQARSGVTPGPIAAPAAVPVPVAAPAPRPVAPAPMPVPAPIAARSEPIAPEPAPAPIPVAAPEPAPAAGRDAIADRLREIVRDRTGYPIEMLELGLDLEADLGIDSIKRVEILGTLRDAVPALANANDGATLDALSRARTLGAIVDRVEQVARKGEAPASAPAATPAATAPSPANGDDAGIRRLVLEAVPTGPFSGRAGLPPGGVVVMTDDGRGVARALAACLEADGHPVEVASASDVDFSSPSAVNAWLGRARRLGEIAAIVHALPLRDAAPAGLDPAAWASRMGPEVRGLFLLAQAAADDLERAARRGGGAILAATGMGGASGSVATGSNGRGDFFPGHGGVAGLVKTLAREWPSVRSRVVDLDPCDPANALAARLLEEFWSESGWTEVGYLAGTRVRLRAAAQALAGRATGGVEVRPGEPILLTGGARGITAAIAAEVARAWKPTLLLCGRSPLPPAEEGAATRDLHAPADLKAALLAQIRRDGRPATAADLERAYQDVTRAREIRANLDGLRRLGATVEYAAVDVRDGDALGRVLDGWRARHGDPVGLIHGAGVIKDKLIRDKTPETFDLVLGTKLDGALNLARLLRPDPVRFAALFSSIAGRFGNEGQADYAAANEVLNKLALWLDRRWPGRVVAMNWGPWSGVGMVSDLEAHLGGRGLGMIPPEVGPAMLVDELRRGRKGEVEIVAAGSLGTLDAPIEVVRPGPARRSANAPARVGR